MNKTIHYKISAFVNVFPCTIGFQMLPYPSSQNFEFNSTLSDIAFTKVTAFLDNWF